MADEFDVVDIVWEALEPVTAGFALYKGNSIDKEKRNHITIRMLDLNELDVIHKGFVNINIFVRKYDKGTPDLVLMKSIVRNVKSALRRIHPPFGMYWKSRIVWSEPLGEAKEGFDCMNIRLEIKTEID